MATFDLFLAHAGADKKRAKELYGWLKQLAPQLNVFLDEESVRPGKPWPLEIQKAQRESLVTVVLVSGATSTAHYVLQEIADAIDMFRERPEEHCAIPVYLDGMPEDPSARPYGLGILQAIDLRVEGGMAQVAERLKSTVAELRGELLASAPTAATAPYPQKRHPKIAVVAVSEELSATQDAVAGKLRGLSMKPEVDPLDAADPRAFNRACHHDFRLALVGTRTGATDVLRRLSEDAASRMIKAKSIDFDKIREEEYPAVKAIRSGVQGTFGDPEDAARLAIDGFKEWYKDWAQTKKGEEPALQPWEEKYLRLRLDKWQGRPYKWLLAGHVSYKRPVSHLYVSLRAVAEPTCFADGEDQVTVLTQEAARAEPSEEERRKRGSPLLERIISHPDLPRLALEGAAGSGKTALLHHVAYVLACRHLNEPAPSSALPEEALAEGAPLRRIPLLVEARALAEAVKEGELGELTEALAEGLRNVTDDPSISTDYLRAGLRAGRYLRNPSTRGVLTTVQTRDVTRARRHGWVAG